MVIKKTKFSSFVIISCMITGLYCLKPVFSEEEVIKEVSKYKDGVYEGISRSIYTYENYYGIAKISIVNKQIADVDFQIIDKDHNELFDQNYGPKHFPHNPLYLEQCKKDWEGVRTYLKKFRLTKDLKKLDAIAGATWSYNIFKDSVAAALKQAE